jgi:membrane protease YdiL (CAAX protease family)
MADAKQTADLESRAASRPLQLARFVPLAIAFYGAVFAIAAGWRLWADGVWPWWAGPAAPEGWATPGAFALQLAVGVTLGALLIAFSRIFSARTESGRRLADELAAVVAGLSTRQALALAAVSGIAEEAFFRGALQPRVGWLAASVLFGLAHFHPRRELRAWSLSAALAGLAFAATFELTGTLVAPAVAHALINGVNLRWLAKRHPAPLAPA